MQLLVISFFLFSFIFTETYEDVIYLKNGSVIYGIIIETKPNEYYKIKSGKNIFVYQIDEIDIIKKELVKDENEENKKKDISNNTWSFGLGIANIKTPTFTTFTKDFKISNNSALFIYFSLQNAYGIGFSHQQNYNDNGIVFGIAFGRYYDQYEHLEDASMTFAYQFRNKRGKNTFWSVGLMLNRYEYWDDYYYWDSYYYDDVGSDGYITETYVIPIVGWDIRF